NTAIPARRQAAFHRWTVRNASPASWAIWVNDSPSSAWRRTTCHRVAAMLMRAAAPSESSGSVPPAVITPSSLTHNRPAAHRPRPSCIVGHTTSGQSIIYHRSAMEGGPLCGHVREPPPAQHGYVLGSGRVQTPPGRRKYGTPIDHQEKTYRYFLAAIGTRYHEP